ncbi:MAG TPA: YkgJ family cysteine cluster protein [Kofleriaceae bacterium]
MQAARTLGEFVADEQIIAWLAEQIQHNHRDSDRGARQVAKHNQLPMHCSTCQATKACCSSFVIVRLYEGLVIADHLKRTGRDSPELRAELRARAETMEATAVADWATPCLFLDARERCTVYEVRPTTCAQLYVYTPPELCNARSSQIVSYTPRNEVAAANEVEAAFRERLSLRRKVGRRYLGVLPRMVLVSLEAWDRADFRDYLRQLPWPTDEQWAEVVRR